MPEGSDQGATNSCHESRDLPSIPGGPGIRLKWQIEITPKHNGPVLIAVLFAALCFAVFVSHVLAQQTLKVEVNLVNVFATVKDAQGSFCEGSDEAGLPPV